MERKSLVLGMLLCLLFRPGSANGLNLRSFGEVTFGDGTSKEEFSGFSLGQLDLWGMHEIDNEGKLRTFFELSG